MRLRCKKIFMMSFFLITLFSVTYICTTILCKEMSITEKYDYSYSNKTPLGTGIKSVKIKYVGTYLDSENKKPLIILDEVVEKFSAERDAVKKMSKIQIAQSFTKENYLLKDITKDEILFSRNVVKYKYNANKYVIGIHGDYVAVFKTDTHGNFILESAKDVSKVKLSKLTEGDVELLKIGDSIYEYDTKEAAKEALIGMFVS